MASHLILGDCLEILPTLEAGSVDAVVTDPPFGKTVCRWDTIISPAAMWPALQRVATRCAALVLLSQQPATSALIMSNLHDFKYCWYWRRSLKTNFLNAKIQPIRQMVDIPVFYRAQCTYNPQGVARGAIAGGNRGTATVNAWNSSGYRQEMTGYPSELLDMAHSNRNSLHPTQKPVALMAYLVRTYTDKGDVVLDFTMGSGTTGVACAQLGRDFIGIEISPEYFAIAEKRIREAEAQMPLPLPPIQPTTQTAFSLA